MAYREGPQEELRCPRCKTRALPPTDVAECACGVWVTAFAAGVVLSEVDRRPDPVLRWWRVREACPVCTEQMTLCGEEPGLLQGCEPHGYWIDADTVAHTKLGDGVDHAAIEAQRSDERRADAERERLLHIEQEQSRIRAERERAEAVLARVDRDAAAEERRPREGVRRPAPEVVSETVRVSRDPGAAALIARVTELETRCARLEQANTQLTERMQELEALRKQLEAFVEAAMRPRSW